ncbi:PREDICTED: TBC1 domain family member 13-like [Amphimedon queenslandica]|uniref:TBC1 domain family member 13 n=1 Tax=Amphimedon queenslandica TaxID=400682 RepID=A0A1X7UQK2_AMPQE|nr:PREDICTED: TBC1 domain family member 13-like [Amphimedon queenslandica]|eukprot:XP_003387077.1 PREDICTED: TBC1 domain family member 13-like [Amphimedon queenslandica]
MASKSKVASFKEVLSKEEIDIEELRRLCFYGCTDKEGIRATCWKILLGYLPVKRKYWEEELRRQRSSYHRLMNDVIINPYKEEDQTEAVDHPLNPNPDSQWHKYFEDNDILLQIDHDTRRLYPEISFFQLPTMYPRKAFNTGVVLGIEALKERVSHSSLPSQKVESSRYGVRKVKIKKNEEEPFSPLKEGEEGHWEVVERILFIYAKMNKGIGYVQGMNEIIGPIYYIFAQHPDSLWKEHAEADTFFCFSNLMVEIGDNFTKKLDRSRAGIGGSMNRLMTLLKDRDTEIHKNLIDKEIDPAFFGFRWITLLLSQEFLLPDVIRLWDSLFSDSERFDFLIYVCTAMIICIRTDILAADFSVTIKLLQNYPIDDMQRILQKAQDIKQFYSLSKR